ncbi:Rid family hydrolase [Azospirillum sp. TSO35-2]|uniref:RidA family protein n=1 Tax=Azospirillum sp. TSO35-2 TaxID=716796 RepID=UPI000D61B37D|nr:Rid family hydrolase [Azospirillum sp. TSO35-2]PWC32762.1 endoribonuclease L-PSP [Azospirillum sp. TSO35-2]
MFDPIDTGIAPPKGPVTATLRAGNIVYSAHIPKDPLTGAIVEGDIETQARQALRNLDQAMRAAGGSLANVVHMAIYLIDRADAGGMNAVYTEFFKPPYPCRATVVVKELLSPGVRIEFVATAVLET